MEKAALVPQARLSWAVVARARHTWCFHFTPQALPNATLLQLSNHQSYEYYSRYTAVSVERRSASACKAIKVGDMMVKRKKEKGLGAADRVYVG